VCCACRVVLTKQATERRGSAGPLSRHRSTVPVPSPSSCVSTDLRGETPAFKFAIYSKRPIESSKQLLRVTLVEKSQSKEFAHFGKAKQQVFNTFLTMSGIHL
jgi:hypothetical protein